MSKASLVTQRQLLSALSSGDFQSGQFLADMLGVRRSGVTEAALKLQAAGLIRYHSGHITVLDRRGLEHRSCECHAVVKGEYARLLPDLRAASDSFSPRDSALIPDLRLVHS